MATWREPLRWVGLRPAVFVVSLSLALLANAGAALAAPEDDVRALSSYLDRAAAGVQAGDLPAARAAYQAYDQDWERIEDGVRDRSRTAYRSIEEAMTDLKIALSTEPVDRDRVLAAVRTLRERGEAFSSGRVSTDSGASTVEPAAAEPADNSRARMANLLAYLDRAATAVANQDAATASREIRGFQQAWPEIEGLVRAKSPSVYASTENAMAEAYARLISTPPDLQRSSTLISSMLVDLKPFAEQQTSYGIFDAAVIMLREGLEALLVIAALLAFLKKAGRPDQQRWIWTGSLAGVMLSVLVAVGAQAAFSRAGAAVGSELLEGITGLIAAAMLFYVSYWLHQKSSLGAWQSYIRGRSTAALSGNSMLSLSAIAFLAVFREGAETVLFYLGIAPSISTPDLLAGIGLGTGVLVLIGLALLVLGLRLPIRPFFLASSVLIYYLGFKFVGTGIHALQVAGVLPATPAPIPANEVLGLFPTWQTALPQLALLAVALAIVLYSQRRSPTRRAVAA